MAWRAALEFAAAAAAAAAIATYCPPTCAARPMRPLYRMDQPPPCWDVSYTSTVLWVETIRTARAEGGGPLGGANVASCVMNDITFTTCR